MIHESNSDFIGIQNMKKNEIKKFKSLGELQENDQIFRECGNGLLRNVARMSV